MNIKILIVDDEKTEVNMLAELLAAHGYDVLKAGGGREAVAIVRETNPDLILLDVAMPDMDGWQVCRLIRSFSQAPVIMLTGKRKTETDIVLGMKYGADEYLTKPVGNRELVARVKAILRRTGTPEIEEPKILCFQNGYLSVDVVAHRVTVGGRHQKLTPREFRLLSLLMENADRVVPHRQMLENIWGWEYIDDVDYVRVYIAHLRRKIEPEPSLPRYIITEPGVGYYFSTRTGGHPTVSS